jgi:hypothetical protein
VRDVWVAGEPVVADGEPAAGRVPGARARAGFREVLRRLWGAA